ncbi:hypothetical protein [Sphingomonas faeni]|uniref:hypothetical protein n=1 Tax=Sphingomonas faeni TaxID=185950 RepID=UPI003361D8BA
MTVAGDPSARCLDVAINRHLVQTEVARLRLYRLKLQITVGRVSPLAIDLAAHGGFQLDDVARCLQPPSSWPWRDVMGGRGCATNRRWRPVGTHTGIKGMTASVPGAWPRLGPGAALMLHAADRRGELAYAVSGNALEAVTRMGDCILQTDQGIARVLLDDVLPETLVAALPGRSLDDMFDHPVLSGRGYVIERVRQPEPSAAHVVTFRTGLLPHSMPWAAELDAELMKSSRATQS